MEPSGENLEKRVRRHVLSREHVFLAVAQPAFRSILRGELEELGFRPGEDTDGGVEFSGRLTEGWRANLLLRTASRIYCRTLDCRAGAREELFRKAAAFPWELWLDRSVPIRMASRVRDSRIRHEGEAAETLREAAARRFSERGQIPPPAAGPETGAPVQRVLLRIVDNRCRVSLDMSGDALCNRGYRLENAGAPLREDLAAALLRALVTGPGLVVDGMTGSGTLAVEAASWFAGSAPGGGRDFAFHRWPSFREAAFRHLADGFGRSGPGIPVVACDIDAGALAVAVRNAERAGIADRVRFLGRDFFGLTGDAARSEAGAEAGARGFLVLNPPYGLRLEGGDREFFRRLGSHVRRSFAGFRSLVLFPSEDTLRAFGGRPAERFAFRHGGLVITAGIFDEARTES